MGVGWGEDGGMGKGRGRGRGGTGRGDIIHARRSKRGCYTVYGKIRAIK